MGIRLLKEGTVTFRIEAQEGKREWYSVESQSLKVESIKSFSSESKSEESTDCE